MLFSTQNLITIKIVPWTKQKGWDVVYRYLFYGFIPSMVCDLSVYLVLAKLTEQLESPLNTHNYSLLENSKARKDK